MSISEHTDSGIGRERTTVDFYGNGQCWKTVEFLSNVSKAWDERIYGSELLSRSNLSNSLLLDIRLIRQM